MTIRDTLKSYFQTGKRPTQSNFANLIDSLALVSEIPQKEEKPYLGVSLLLNCNGLGPNMPIITHTLLENTLTNLHFNILDNCISISSSDTIFEFNLKRIFINIGALNDTCGFDKVIFSLNESTSTALVLYCESIETNTKDPGDLEGGPIIIDPGMELPNAAISFQQLPIEIRVYNEIVEDGLPISQNPHVINP